MAFSKKAIHITILYVLVLLLFVLIAFFVPQQQEEWVCVQELCVESEPAGQAWAMQNCGEVETDTGEVIVACAIVVDGVEQIIPLDALNLSAIQSCTLYQCVQEVPVRAANYTYTP